MSYVFIWANNVMTTGHGWPGHVSMNIGGVTIARFTNDEDYVSWWPKTEETKKESSLGQNINHVVTDISREGYLPDYIYELADTLEKRAAMQACWKAIYTKATGHYRLYLKNCSTVVARVLRAGGYSAGAYSGIWYDHSTIWTPLKIAEFVSRAGGTSVQWDTFKAKLEAMNITAADFVVDQGPNGKRNGELITMARDNRFCKCGAPCKY
jgi:hypothetical protein